MLVQWKMRFQTLRRIEWPIRQIMEMERRIESQEQEVSRLGMVVSESERCVSLVLDLRTQTLPLIFS